MLRLRVKQVSYYLPGNVRPSIRGLIAIMRLTESKDALARKAGGAVVFPYPGKKVNFAHSLQIFCEINIPMGKNITHINKQ